MKEVTIIALLAIIAVASAGRLCCASERNENRKPPQKADNARKVFPILRPGSSQLKNRVKAKISHPGRLKMYDPELYALSNQIQRRDARETLLSCPLVHKWRSGALLDIGCGSGDVTIEIITKYLPESFERVVGADLSEEMIHFAREHCSHPCISFEKFDVGLELEKQNIRDIEPFDHITSFNCLHWVALKNQPIAVKNMYKLLKPGGDMVLLFVVKHPIYNVFKDLSMMKEWAEYMIDVETIFSPYYYSEDPAAEYEHLLWSNGFSECNVMVREMLYTFEGAESLRNTYAALNPFLKRIPENQRKNHLDAMVDLLKNRYSKHIGSATFLVSYQSIVAYAKKGHALLSA